MIIIVCPRGMAFPNGTAPTARVTAYARGLTEQGSEVLVLCTGTSEIPKLGILNHDIRGNANGVEFEYTCGTTIRGNSFVERRWHEVKGALVAANRILCAKNKGKVEAILLYPDTFCSSLWYWLVAKLCGTPYLLERNEHPFYGVEQKGWRNFVASFYLRAVYPLFDGVIVISDFLMKHMKQYMNPNARLLKIPILVDAEIFSSSRGKRPIEGRYIAYCGTLNEHKDGVLTLLKAFALMAEEFDDLKLLLIGDSYGSSQVPLFKSYARELGLVDRVVFTGMIGREQLPAYLCSATILALARPQSTQAEAGFPTKVGEYLATGNPTVLTDTGELCRYLEDAESAYFVPPDDHVAFAERLKYVMLNPDSARKVGYNGRQVACRYFGYKENGNRLLEFITSLAQKVSRQ